MSYLRGEFCNNAVSMLNTYGFGAGVRLIMTGAIIIVVIVLASGRNTAQR
jgi:ribose transport system permease protein